MNDSKRYKIISVIVGSILIGFGVGLAILSGYGGDAISVFSEGLSKIFDITIGKATLVYYGVFLIPVIFVDRKQIGIGTFLSPLTSSIVMDLVLENLVLGNTVIINLTSLIIGIFAIGIGLGIYVKADLGRSSYDAFILYISSKINKSVGIIKVLGDFLLCIIGYLLGGTIGLGPVLAVIMIGPILQKTLDILNSKNN